MMNTEKLKDVTDIRLASTNALDDLKISSADFLDLLTGRSLCPKCGKSRKYFCYTCYVAMDEIADRIPKLHLPIKVDIIKHPGEVDGKSTASHAAILAPDDVSVYVYPDIPDYEDKTKVLLVFPGKNAKTLKEIAEMYHLATTEKLVNAENVSEVNRVERRSPLKFCFPFERVILIDSTWNQVRAIRKDERLKDILKLELVGRNSLFWRFQRGKPRTYLSTIESIYYLIVDLHTLFIDSSYSGEYDNLLFFFKFMFQKINTIYEPERLRVNRPMSEFPIHRRTDANL
ncbi:DTW domain-containing protein 1 [Chamberlinius hualienensis]